MRWLDRAMIRFPFSYTLCVTEKEYVKVCKKYDLPIYPWGGKAGATFQYGESGEYRIGIVTMQANHKDYTINQIHSMLAHEATHAVQKAMEIFREDPSEEFQAYATENFCLELFNEYDRKIKKLKRKLKTK